MRSFLGMKITFAAAFVAAFLTLAKAGECAESEVRLEGLESRQVGRVQVCEKGQWREVCADSGRWRESNAVVVCRQLGYSSGAVLTSSGSRLGLATSNSSSHSHVTCSGLETALHECVATQAVDCRGPTPIVMCTNNPEAGSVRLIHSVDEEVESSGVVEVFTDSEWVGVCTDDWSKEDSRVVCRQLGYPSGSATITRPHATVIRRLPLKRLNYVQCSGAERSLMECNHTLYSSQCYSASYASVNCTILPDHSNGSDSQGADCPPVSKDVVMSFALVQLLVLALSVLLNSIILLAWTRWRKRRKAAATVAPTPATNCPLTAGAPPPSPPSYSDISRDTLLETGGEATPTNTN